MCSGLCATVCAAYIFSGAREGASDASDGFQSPPSNSLDLRMVSAFEASVGLMSRTMDLKDLKGRDKEMDNIRNMLSECGEFMTTEERHNWGRKLYELYKQNIEDNGASNDSSAL